MTNSSQQLEEARCRKSLIDEYVKCWSKSNRSVIVCNCQSKLDLSLAWELTEEYNLLSAWDHIAMSYNSSKKVTQRVAENTFSKILLSERFSLISNQKLCKLFRAGFWENGLVLLIFSSLASRTAS